MKIEKIRHSLSHVLAAAVQELYSEVHPVKSRKAVAVKPQFNEVKFGIGPAIENGFYYDFDLTSPFSENDLPKIEKKMIELIKKNLKFEKKIISKTEANKLFKNQPYKLELIKEIAQVGPVSIYQSGNFIDLCAGPHIKQSKEIPLDSFKLTKIAGAYWKGDEKNKMLTRIYGLAFKNKKELNDYLKLQEEAEKRDHRILGQKLELFLLDENIGAGLPIWIPKGAIVRKIIENYLYEELQKADYQWLYTPHIGSRKLWEVSGHWNFYNESMYPVLEISQCLEDFQKNRKTKNKEEYLLKPMNCPFHLIVYNSKIRSYKDLPLKFAELGTVYRYEKSGTLHGLTRVRGFTQDDAHLICTQKQMPEELEKLVKHGLKMLNDFGFNNYNIYLSTRPEKYTGSLLQWKKATNILKRTLNKLKIKYQEDKGGGVFYGPKIDIKIKDALSREWQCTTVQFDFNVPDRFKMRYINDKGEKEEPYMIHRALLGSLERFMGVLIEHYAGAFPLWLAPEQIWVISISDKHQKYAQGINNKLLEQNFRSKLKSENETISKKIREGEMQKIPYLLIIGDKEIKSKSISVRQRNKGDIGEMKLDKFIEKIKKEIEKKQ